MVSYLQREFGGTLAPPNFPIRNSKFVIDLFFLIIPPRHFAVC